MEADKHTWFTPTTFENRIRTDVVIPENALEQTEYYNKLQQQSANQEEADYESMEEN
jgi:hypothetical protein